MTWRVAYVGGRWRLKRARRDPRKLADDARLIAVVDSNVFLEVWSCHDLAQAYEQPEETPDLARKRALRWARARDSLLLAIYFHQIRAATYGLKEAYSMLAGIVDPDADTTVETHFTTFFSHFVKDCVLKRWMPAVQIVDLKGNAADAALLGYAREHALPLITNEGYSHLGLRDEKLRKAAKDADVAVFTPREFWTGKLAPERATDWFLRTFARKAPTFIHRHPRPHIAEDTLRLMFGIYGEALDAEGRDGAHHSMSARRRKRR